MTSGYVVYDKTTNEPFDKSGQGWRSSGHGYFKVYASEKAAKRYITANSLSKRCAVKMVGLYI